MPLPPKKKPAHALDPRAFNSLFFDTTKNKEAIWDGLGTLVKRAARRFSFRHVHDAGEAKGEALALAGSLISSYDPKRRRACAYFYRVIRNELLRIVADQRRQPVAMSMLEHERRPNGIAGSDNGHKGFEQVLGEVGFSELATASPPVSDGFHDVRSASPQNWHSFRITGAINQFRIEKHLRIVIAKAMREAQLSESPAERAACAFIIEDCQQHARAFLGRRLKVRALRIRHNHP